MEIRKIKGIDWTFEIQHQDEYNGNTHRLTYNVYNDNTPQDEWYEIDIDFLLENEEWKYDDNWCYYSNKYRKKTLCEIDPELLQSLKEVAEDYLANHQ